MFATPVRFETASPKPRLLARLKVPAPLTFTGRVSIGWAVGDRVTLKTHPTKVRCYVDARGDEWNRTGPGTLCAPNGQEFEYRVLPGGVGGTLIELTKEITPKVTAPVPAALPSYVKIGAQSVLTFDDPSDTRDLTHVSGDRWHSPVLDLHHAGHVGTLIGWWMYTPTGTMIVVFGYVISANLASVIVEWKTVP
jgi:hypothetical protein